MAEAASAVSSRVAQGGVSAPQAGAMARPNPAVGTQTASVVPVAVTTQTPTSSAVEPQRHLVKQGDSVWSLWSANNAGQTWTDYQRVFKSQNPQALSADGRLRMGAQVVLPPQRQPAPAQQAKPGGPVVARGDSVWKYWKEQGAGRDWAGFSKDFTAANSGAFRNGKLQEGARLSPDARAPEDAKPRGDSASVGATSGEAGKPANAGQAAPPAKDAGVTKPAAADRAVPPAHASSAPVTATQPKADPSKVDSAKTAAASGAIYKGDLNSNMSPSEVIKALGEPQAYAVAVGGKVGPDWSKIKDAPWAQKLGLDKINPETKIMVAAILPRDAVEKDGVGGAFAKAKLFVSVTLPGSKPRVVLVDPHTMTVEAGKGMMPIPLMGGKAVIFGNERTGASGASIGDMGVSRSLNAGVIFEVPGSNNAFKWVGNFLTKGSRVVQAAEVATGVAAAPATGGGSLIASAGAVAGTELTRYLLNDAISSGKMYVGGLYRADISLSAKNGLTMMLPGGRAGTVDVGEATSQLIDGAYYNMKSWMRSAPEPAKDSADDADAPLVTPWLSGP